MLDRSRYRALGLEAAYDAVLAGERLTPEQGLALLDCPDILAVGALAHCRRRALHGDAAYYVVNQHLNYTNVCVNGCLFCAYRREEGQSGGYTMSVDDALATIEARLASGQPEPTEVHVVGGCHPRLPLAYYEELLAAIRARLPKARLKCFTAVEIAHFAALEGVSEAEVLTRLQAVGLEMLPGGGAEIFAPAVRQQICPKKIDADHWLSVHRLAHGLGIRTNCTMLFGHLESHADRIDHLARLRELQDETGGFTCFIPLPFLTQNNPLQVPRPLDGLEELRTIAVSRLMLDNVPHIKAYWVMLSVKQAQLALRFGADDLDGTVVEEKIGHEAGADSRQVLTRRELEAMIRGCGLEPVERDALFHPLHPMGQGEDRTGSPKEVRA
ncbi:MAG: aminofutalosine synthase MqnE [Desulfovibrionaceae bacterium]